MRSSQLSLHVLVRRCRISTTLVIALLIASMAPAAAEAQRSVQDVATPEAVLEHTRLFADEQGLLDRFGRIPVARITFEPGATLSPVFFVAPLLVVVEEGTFEITVQGVATSVGSTDHVEIPGDALAQVQNVGTQAGSLIALAIFDLENWSDFALWGPPAYAPEPGIVTDVLSLELDLKQALAPRVFSIDQIEIPAGEKLDSLDFGGATATESIIVVVEEGTIWSTDGEATSAGDPLRLSGDEAAIEWIAIGGKPARLFVIRIAVAATR